MDKKLMGIIEEALKTPLPKCPICNIEGVMKGCSIVAWCECPKCEERIDESVIY